MVIKRGDIHWLDLGEPRGSGPGYLRPVVVIQDDDFNKTNINTTIIAVVTTSLRLANMDGNVLVMPSRKNGLEKPSVVNVTQLYTIDKAELGELIGSFAAEELALIDKGLNLVLSLKRDDI